MKNNRIMYKFKGTINGVEYTNKKAFFEALKTLDPKSRCNVRVEEESIPKSKGQTLAAKPADQDKKDSEKQSKQKPVQKQIQTTPGYEDLFSQLFGGLFLSFLKAQNPQLYNKLVAKNRGEKPAARPELDIRQIPPVPEQEVFQNIARTYFFPETTYEFKGTAEDDWHLDRFSELLAKRAKEIKSENLSRLTRDQLNVLYRRSLDEYARISNKINEIDTRLKEFDKSLAGLENIIKAYENVGLTVPQNIKVLFSDTKSGFDQLTNRKNYYLLLLEHYRNVGPYFDPAR